MKRWMSGLAVIMVALPVSAEPEKLKPVDVQQLLERLQELEEGAQGRSSARLNTARAAFTSAAQSDSAAYELFLKCVEKVEYEDADKSSRAFREWKKQQKERMGPEFKRALRHQLNWLLLVTEVGMTHEMTPEKEAAHRSKAIAKLDQIIADLEEMGGERRLLKNSVLGSVFAASYGISGVQLEMELPLAPLQVDAVFEELIFPPLRKPERVGDLREAWLKRIRLEEILVVPVNAKERGLRNDDAPAQVMEFRLERRPEMIWQMEVDLFEAGDERGAARRMVEHIEKHLGHKSEKQWVEEFQGLVSGGGQDSTATTES